MDTSIIKEMNQYAFNKKNWMILPEQKDQTTKASPEFLAAMLANFADLGYTIGQEDLEKLATYTEEEIDELVYQPVYQEARRSKGDHVEHKLLFPDFPESVKDMDLDELSFLRFVSYFTTAIDAVTGTDPFANPDSITNKAIRDRFKENNIKKEAISKAETQSKMQPIIIKQEKDFEGLIQKALKSRASLSEYDQGMILWALNNLEYDKIVPKRIGFKETEALLNRYNFENNKLARIRVQNINDFQRLLAAIEGRKNTGVHKTEKFRNRYYTTNIYAQGDIALSEKQHFRNYTNQERKKLFELLNMAIEKYYPGMLNSMSTKRAQRFIRNVLNGNLHFNSSKYNNAKYTSICDLSANLHSVREKYENAMHKQNYLNAAEALAEISAGSLCRNFKTILDNAYKNGKTMQEMEQVYQVFEKNVNRMNIAMLINLQRQIDTNDKHPFKVDMVKSSNVKLNVRENTSQTLPKEWADKTRNIITKSIIQEYATRAPLGKVYIDPDLAYCPVPTINRNSSGGHNAVMAGTRIPLNSEDKDILHAVLYKKCPENGYFDFSAGMLDEHFNLIKQISWNNLKESANGKLLGYHSGDSSYTENGHSEVIDIDKEVLKEECPEAKYVVYQALAWNESQYIDDCSEIFIAVGAKDEAQDFKKEKVRNKELYPADINTKFDLSGHSSANIPLIYDIENDAVYVMNMPINRTQKDIFETITSNSITDDTERHFNLTDTAMALENFHSEIALAMYAIMNAERANMYEIAEIAAAYTPETEIVQKIEKADTVFSTQRGILAKIEDERDDKTVERVEYTPYDGIDFISDIVARKEQEQTRERQESMEERVMRGAGTAWEEDELEDFAGIDVGHTGYIDKAEKALMGLINFDVEFEDDEPAKDDQEYTDDRENR